MSLRLPKIVFAAAFLSLLFIKVSGQDIHFSQYNASPLLLNPALAGMNTCDYRAYANFRTQWLTVSDGNTYRTFAGGADMSVGKVTKYQSFAGLGLSFFADQAGAINFMTNRVDLSFAYHFMLNRKATKEMPENFALRKQIISHYMIILLAFFTLTGDLSLLNTMMNFSVKHSSLRFVPSASELRFSMVTTILSNANYFLSKGKNSLSGDSEYLSTERNFLSKDNNLLSDERRFLSHERKVLSKERKVISLGVFAKINSFNTKNQFFNLKSESYSI